MRQYSDDLPGGHNIEIYKLDDGRYRARVTNTADLLGKEWFGSSELEVTKTALEEIAQMEHDGVL